MEMQELRTFQVSGTDSPGKTTVEKRPKNRILIIVSALIFIDGAVGCFFYNEYVTKYSAAPLVTRVKYDQIREGMTHAAVVHIIGVPGDQSATSRTPAARGAKTKVSMKTWRWGNSDGTYLTATFKDGLLVNKIQSGLR